MTAEFDDIEKAPKQQDVAIPDKPSSSTKSIDQNSEPHHHQHTPAPIIPVPSLLHRLNTFIESLSGLEARGITRVSPSERNAPSLWDDISIALLWFSANISVNNLAVGLLGPLVFELGFLDCAMCAVFGSLLGSISTAYMSMWGPRSGNRTMVVLRYFMGYWPAKIPTFLNIILMVGYCTIDAILAGQILSAVNGGHMTIVVGIIVVQVVCSVVAIFGMKAFHYYERIAWLPQLLILFILIGSASPSFLATTESIGTPSVIAANRLSFFSLCLYVPNSWGAAASDFYVYYPEKTSRTKVFLMTLTGLWLAFCLVFMLGIGFATGITENEAWATANDISIGALLVSGFGPLAGFGKFCAVILALGVIANSIPGTYSASLGFQVLGRYGLAVPRWVWSAVLILVELVLALAGREHLLVIIQNFVALMGYWVEFMVFIVLVEHMWFRRSMSFDWERWDDQSYLPIGAAALTAFLLGWMGAILGMYQVWYTGPLANVSGPADVGMWVGTGFTVVSYVPLRYLEISYTGR